MGGGAWGRFGFSSRGRSNANSEMIQGGRLKPDYGRKGQQRREGKAASKPSNLIKGNGGDATRGGWLKKKTHPPDTANTRKKKRAAVSSSQ